MAHFRVQAADRDEAMMEGKAPSTAAGLYAIMTLRPGEQVEVTVEDVETGDVYKFFAHADVAPIEPRRPRRPRLLSPLDERPRDLAAEQVVDELQREHEARWDGE